MTRDERKLLNKLRRRTSWLILAIISILVWTKNVHDDYENAIWDKSHLLITIQNKDTQIKKLYHIVDSLKKPIPVEVKEVKVKKVKKAKIDSTLILNIDSSVVFPKIDSSQKVDSL